MKVLFLIFHGLSAASGISKKIIAQVEGLRQCGHEVHLCTYDIKQNGHRCRFVDNDVISDFGSNRLAPIRKRCSYTDVYNYCVRNGISFVYARSFQNANPWTIRLFARLKKAGVRTVLEIPTYPYDQEFAVFPFFTRMELKVDQLFRRTLAAQFNAIVTFSDADKIFGQRTIRISNGVDFDAIPVRHPHQDRPNELHLIGVAEVHVWHAYDRMIRGLAAYYKDHPNPELKVYFHIVGGVCNDDLVPWTAFIREQGIVPYVIFHGQQTGGALTDLFNNADFAIGSLGRHRSGITKIKTLKNREYAARGIPFIYSEVDDDFERMPYILKAPADESPISVSDIINFHSHCKIPPIKIRQSIQYCSWKNQMSSVLEQLS